MKVALVYDRINKWGGAERVLLVLHKLFPDAPLYASVYDEENASWAKVFKIHPSFLQKIPGAKRLHEFFAPLMPIAFETFDFDEFDVVISVTSEAAKGLITHPKTLHICLCLTPTRYLWSGYQEYFRNPIMKFLSAPVVSYLKVWDRIASQRPDYYVAISNNVADRVQTYYNRESEILYPPVSLGGSGKSKVESSPYFLLVSRLSRLTAYKRVDMAIAAANTLKIPLKIVGAGRDIEYFRNMAGDTVEVVGGVSDEELSEYYSNCQALISPGVEDFGLVMAEAQAHGKPVISYRRGGALEIIQEGVTGEFFDEQTPDSLAQVLAKFDVTRYNSEKCIENAQRFSHVRFEKEFFAFFEKKVKEYFK